MKRKALLYALLLLTGGALALVGGVALTGDALKAASGVCVGIGAGLFGMSASQLILLRVLKRRPEVRRQMTIDTRDERNVLLNHMAKARAFTVMAAAYAILVLVFALIGEGLLPILLMIGAYLIGWGTYFVSLARYAKAM
jgi:hypothetical protein